MKYFIVVLACVAAASAQNVYRPFQYNNQVNPFPQFNRQPYQQQYRYSTPRPVVTPVYQPVIATAAPTPYPVPAPVAKVYNGDSRNANTVSYQNEANPDGSFVSSYQTDNGIAASAQGTPRAFNTNPPVAPVVIQGSFSWTSPEGQPIAITYIADENGYRAEGPAIPVAPEVPAQIARALAYTAQYAQKQ